MEFELTAENFSDEVLNADKRIVDFFAPWCSPCMMMMPTIEYLYDDDVLPIGRVNVEDDPGLAREYGVMSVPTLIVFKNGKAAARLGGYHSEEDIINFYRSV
ncbi:MAG: thioredoxin fold domain-containing protein [Clostridia bacterium]|nr:thioredoxin fold domain-containing protein [Clostridia bacterium]